MSKLVLIVINIDGSQELLSSLLVINELTLRNNTGIQYFVSVVNNKKIIIYPIYYMYEVCIISYCCILLYVYLCLKSAYMILLGKPFLQILIPSSTPLHLSWWMTRKFCI